MKINLKIILPILILLSTILITFGYILYYIDKEVDSISEQTAKFKQLNNLSYKLSKEQEITEYNMIVYLFNQDPQALIAINQSELEKAKTIDDIYPLVDSSKDKELIDEYIDVRRNITTLRSDLLQAAKTQNKNLIDQKYVVWNEQTLKIRNSINKMRDSNNSSLTSIFNSFKDIGVRIAQVVIGLFILVVLVVFLFYYFLKYTLTSPIIKLSKYADEIAVKNFSTMMDSNLVRDDEIGSLFRAFTNMSKNLKNIYSSLEQNVKDRTLELTHRTQELEKTQQATLSILEDLNTERQTLIETRALDEAVLSSIGDGLVVIDDEGKITYTNKSFEDITGWRGDEVFGKSFIKIIPSEKEDGERIADKDRFIQRIISGENPEGDVLNTVYYVRKDGTRFPVSSLVKRIILDGKVVGAVKTFRDITKEKDIDKSKSEFVSLAAHQLRTPLSAISWYTEMLLSEDAGALSELQKKHLQQVYQGNQRMIDMVRSFLNVSRIDMGDFVIDKQPTNIVDLLNDTIKEQDRKMLNKNIKLSFEHPSSLPTINIDQNRIRMVFQNLLSNAIKYTPENGEINISVKINNEENLLIQFTDTGYGIPKESQPKIFTKLYRAENVVERATEGTGLGLYIVKNIVESSGGKIWFTSELDKGTTFYFTLPL